MSSGKDDIAESAAATLVEYKRLGNSGLRVSMPIFGCMSFGSSKWAPWVIEEEKVCLHCLSTCWNSVNEADML